MRAKRVVDEGFGRKQGVGKPEVTEAAEVEGQGKLTMTTSKDQSPAEKKETRAGNGFLFMVFCVLGVCASTGCAENKQLDMEIDAVEMCKDFVRDRLKSPGSATFPRFPEFEIKGSGNGPYKISSTVDAENSFGAKPRLAFTCTVTYEGDDHWRLIDINLDE